VLWVVAALFAFVAMGAVLYLTPGGPAVSSDSTHYVSTALNMLHGRGVTDFTGNPLTEFPPGYPSLLVMSHWIGIGVSGATRVINVLAMGAVVLLSFVLLRRHVRSTLVQFIGLATIAFSPALLAVDHWVLSEPLFWVLALGALVLLEVAETNLLVAASGFMAAAATLVRYPGFALAITGLVVFALARRWRAVALFGVSALTPPALWLVRNASTSQGATGYERQSSAYSPPQVASQYLRGIESFVLPSSWPPRVQVVAGLAVFSLVVAGVIFSRNRALLTLVVFVVAFSLVTVMTAATTTTDPIQQRLLTPICAPFVILAAAVLDDRFQSRRAETGTRVLTALAGVFAVVTAGLFFSVARQEPHPANDYASSVWRKSALANAVVRLPVGTVTSDSPEALYEVTGRQPIEAPPNVIPRDWTVCGYVAWFNRAYRGAADRLPEVKRHADLVAIHSYDDGTLYKAACQ
jgi:hypothetical protein